MRYNQILGYADANGLSKPVVLLGPGEPDDKKFELIADARDRHVFPSGIKRIALVGWEAPKLELQFISDDVARATQNEHKRQQDLQTAAREREKILRDSQANFTAANRLFQSASSKRNLAIAKLSAAEAALSSKTLEEKYRSAQIKSVEDAKKAVTSENEAFNKILEQFNIVRNPKSTPEQKQAAYIALGVVKSPETISAPEQAAANTTTTK